MLVFNFDPHIPPPIPPPAAEGVTGWRRALAACLAYGSRWVLDLVMSLNLSTGGLDVLGMVFMIVIEL